MSLYFERFNHRNNFSLVTDIKDVIKLVKIEVFKFIGSQWDVHFECFTKWLTKDGHQRSSPPLSVEFYLNGTEPH